MNKILGGLAFVIVFVAVFVLRLIMVPGYALLAGRKAYHMNTCEDCRARLRAKREREARERG